MKVLFFGTPEIAVPTLKWLIEHETVVGVVCQPDKPVGRGYKIVPPPVKEFSLDNNLPVFQPAGSWTESTIQELKATGADVGIVIAYGRIMPAAVLAAPRLGCVNIHFSLLPKYRGAAPMQWALVNGEKETGVTAFWLIPEMDAGPIFHQTQTIITPSDDAISLRQKLTDLGVGLLPQIFQDLKSNHISRLEQKGPVVKAPLLKKEDGRIDWNAAATSIVNKVRGLVEWPVAFTTISSPQGAKQLKILKAEATEGKGKPGQIVSADHANSVIVGTGTGAVRLLEVQPEGKKSMSAWAFWQGAHLKTGDFLG